jgi:hypothetical protein
MQDISLLEMATWYAKLAMKPGWADYTRHHIKELAKDYPTIYGDFPRLVSEEFKRLQAELAGSQPSVKG